MGSQRDSPFFVVGADRSGTTLFRLMLNTHPRLRVPRESHFLPALLDALPVDRPLGPDELQKAFALIAADPWWRQWEVTDEDLRALLSSLESPRLADVVDAIFRAPGNPGGKPRWGDKTPIYIRDIGRIAALFPDAKFIHVIRDGRDVCLSLHVNWWGRHPLRRAYYWDKTIRMGWADGLPLGPGRYLEIAYENLVLDSEATLRRVCAFLGEDYDPCMLQFYEGASSEIAAEEKAIHAKTGRAPKPSDAGRWRREMRGGEVALIELVAGDTLARAGYQRRFRWLAPVTRGLRMVRGILSPILLPLRNSLVRRFPELRHYT